MALLPIYETPHPMLREVALPVEVIDDEVRTLIDDMFDTMYDARGIGLAAIQVGVKKRVVVIDLQEPGEDDEPVRDPRVFVNPEIVWTSEELTTYSEGCLSVPEQYADVDRPARCKVKWLDGEGVAHEEEFDGLMATCIQHEVDHLNGIVFIDYISRLKREMILKKLNKARRAA